MKDKSVYYVEKETGLMINKKTKEVMVYDEDLGRLRCEHSHETRERREKNQYSKEEIKRKRRFYFLYVYIPIFCLVILILSMIITVYKQGWIGLVNAMGALSSSILEIGLLILIAPFIYIAIVAVIIEKFR